MDSTLMYEALRAGNGNVISAYTSDGRIEALSQALRHWRLRPTGTEGYRTAEVTLGGVATDGLSSQTMEAKAVPGLYFIGEAVDVTGEHHDVGDVGIVDG